MSLIQSKDINLRLSRTETLAFDLVIFGGQGNDCDMVIFCFVLFFSAHRGHGNTMIWKLFVYIGGIGQNIEELSVR